MIYRGSFQTYLRSLTIDSVKNWVLCVKIWVCICICTHSILQTSSLQKELYCFATLPFFFFQFWIVFIIYLIGFDWTSTDIYFSFSAIHFFTSKASQNERMAEVDTDLWRLPKPTHLLKPSSIRSGCPELCTVRLSLQMETAQHLSATWFCVWPPSH